MFAVGIHAFGGPEVVVPVDIPPLPLGDGEVEIAVRATTVNPADVMLRRGQLRDVVQAEPPFVGGLELSGTVTAAAPGVGFSEGDEVAAITSFIPGGRGGHVARAVLDARRVARIPAGLDAVHAATVPMNGLTARLAVDRLALRPGRTLAVVGAGGAVGAYVIELAVAAGVRVVAVGSERHEAFVRGLGAEVFVLRGDDLAARLRHEVPGGLDGLVDAALVGPSVLPAVADGGRVIVVRGDADAAAERGIEVIRVSVQHYATRNDDLIDLLDRAASGGLTTRVAAEVPATTPAEAHRLLERGGLDGRIVLILP